MADVLGGVVDGVGKVLGAVLDVINPDDSQTSPQKSSPGRAPIGTMRRISYT